MPYDPSQRFQTPDINPLLSALIAAMSGGGQATAQAAQPPPQTPAGDMRPIVATAPPSMPAVAPSAPVYPTGHVTGIPERTTSPVALPAEGAGMPDWLKQMLPALLSTGAGLAFPAALPGAAGFNEGYGKQLSLNKKLGLTPIMDYNTDTGQMEVVGYGNSKTKIIRHGNPHSTDEKTRAQAAREVHDMMGTDPQKFYGAEDPGQAYNDALNAQIEIINSSKQTGAGVKTAQAKTAEVQNSTQVPDGIPSNVWNQSTPEQKQEYLRKRYGG